jgi:hypothetical protein
LKSRLTLIFAALVVLLGAMVWVVADRATATTSGFAPSPTPAPLRAFAPETDAGFSGAARTGPAAAGPTPVWVRAGATPAVPVPAAAETRPAGLPRGQVASSPTLRVDASGDVTYDARAGDTVSELAAALLGSDSREHREAVIAAHSSLRADPDRVLAGKAYSVDRSPTRAAAAPAAVGDAPVATAASAASPRDGDSRTEPAAGDATRDEPAPAARERRMTYMARIGDTVRVLAAHLLGGDTKANRDAIVAGNASLRRDPDRMVAGENYTIVARDGLSADPAAPEPQASSAEPEADEILRLGTGRSLRYTARAGDTVSKLAAALLGGDTRANRESIINDNPGLRDDPDHLVAGQTYLITAPLAE